MEKFKHEAVMLSEIILVHHSHDIVLILRVFLHDVVEVLGFLVSKFMVHLSISSNLDSVYGLFSIFVVFALDHLCKGAFSENFHDLVPIGNVLSYLNLEIALKIIKDRVTLKLTI